MTDNAPSIIAWNRTKDANGLHRYGALTPYTIESALGGPNSIIAPTVAADLAEHSDHCHGCHSATYLAACRNARQLFQQLGTLHGLNTTDAITSVQRFYRENIGSGHCERYGETCQPEPNGTTCQQCGQQQLMISGNTIHCRNCHYSGLDPTGKPWDWNHRKDG